MAPPYPSSSSASIIIIMNDKKRANNSLTINKDFDRIKAEKVTSLAAAASKSKMRTIWVPGKR